MSLSLEEKRAFFEQLDACRNYDDESDTLSIKEQTLRQQCRAFYTTTSPVPRPKIASLRHRRTASAPAPKPIDDELEIIAVTPRDHRPADSASASHGLAFSDSIIPETDQRPKKSLPRQTAHPATRLLRPRSGHQEHSPSTAMAKRKRPSKPLRMAPESKQIFKGLCFFYIPNNDINPVRRLRITKAREHGAEWTQNLAGATHVIVDTGLSYDEIKSILPDSLTSSSIVLVNDQYPIECLRRGTVFDPNMTVEKYQYKVPGDLAPAEQPTIPRSSTQGSNTSLQLKPHKDTLSAINTTPASTQRSSDLIPSSYPEAIRSPGEVARPAHGMNLPANSESRSPAPAPAPRDELATCIDAVLDDPEKHEYLDDSNAGASDSENETQPKKRRKRHLRPRESGTGTNFGKDRFLCMKGGIEEKKLSGPNADTIQLLEEMAEEYSLWNETWKVQSYRKAVATLRRQPTKVKTAKEAAALPNIGRSLAGHIEEIVATGRFEKLDQARSEPSRKALKTFCGIYGVGVPTARKWVELGYRDLDDLRSKAKLTPNQKIGLDHYDDLLTRIPRAEVRALGNHIKDVAAAIDSDVELIIGGSYRRGASTSGDVDIIVTKGGTSSTQDLAPFLDKLVDALTETGFLTAALASHRHGGDGDGGGNKWHGCCVLPEAAFPGRRRDDDDYRPIWRRIDFLLVPATSIGAALIYFTGNDLFNRSMRLLARRKGMRLNHRALSGAGVDEGRDEKKIFQILGVQWREPHERWC